MEFRPKKFPGAVMRIRTPRTTALIFKSGKLVVCGAHSEEIGQIACRQYAKAIFKATGVQSKLSDIQVQNVVGSTKVGFEISLESLRLAAGQHCTYEPEIFAGLHFRM